MSLLHQDYLSKRMCKGLSSYKYQSSGTTWLDDLHDPCWEWCVQRMPRWLAPNLITLTGTLLIIAAHDLLIAYAPELDGENAPAWVHAFAGVAILLYVNLDCMDGKQARRTGTSSPLGQLFDHGCDALVTGLLIINVATSVALQLSPTMVLMMFAPLVLWIMSQWEEYHTGHMMYGNGYYGVLEANYAFAICHLVSAAFGAAAWHKPLAAVLPFVPEGVRDVTIVHALFWTAMLFIGGQMVGQTWRVFSGEHGMDARERGHKELGALNATKHLLYIALFFALAYLFLMQPVGESRYRGRMLLETVSIGYSTIATQVILAHMAKDAYVPAVSPYIALAAGVANGHLGIFQGDAPTYVIAAAVLVGYLHYVICVCNQVAQHLGIQCLVISSTG